MVFAAQIVRAVVVETADNSIAGILVGNFWKGGISCMNAEKREKAFFCEVRPPSVQRFCSVAETLWRRRTAPPRPEP
jgi:hypothetical protein